MNIDLLMEILNVQSCSNEDDAMIEYINSKIIKKDVTIEEDSYGNIYVTKGNSEIYPCIVSHIDTVHKIINDFKPILLNDIVFAFSEEKRSQVGIGGDDKCGIYICLKALDDLDFVKVVFFRNEEIGKIGSRFSITNHKEWFDDCSIVLQADRRGSSDFIKTSSGIDMFGDEFVEKIDNLLKSYNYNICIGVSTDVDELVRGGIGICCANVSCGYYMPHTSYEYIIISELDKCYNLICEIILSTGLYEKNLHTYTPKVYSYNSGSNYAYNTNYYNNRNKNIHIQEGFIINTKNIFLRDSDGIVKNININKSTHCKSFKCNECNNKTVYYLKDDRKFYCINCNDSINGSQEDEMFKKLSFLDINKVVYVYSYIYNGFIEKHKSFYSTNCGTYILDEDREFYTYNEYPFNNVY